jgi:hypothetical protein
VRTLFISFLLLISGLKLIAQTTGDFRSRTTGPLAWNSTTAWQRFNGSTWQNTTNFPGQVAGNYNVLIRPGHIITNPTMPATIGGIVTVSGILRLTNNADYTLRTATLIVTPGTGTPTTGGGLIQFQGNNTLFLPANATISVTANGISHSNCTASQRIVIGTIVLSTCNGNGPGDPVSFEDLMDANGSLVSIINSIFPNCTNTASTAVLTPAYLGLPGSNLSYQWEITLPNGTNLNSNSDPLNLDLDQLGDYIIKLTFNTIYAGGAYSNTRTIVYNNKVTTWNGSEWSNGTPNIDTRVVINGDYNGPSFSACSLKVNSGASLTIPAGHYIEVSGILVNEGLFTVEDKGTLHQIQNVNNVGNITYKRTATHVHRLDYIYWSSPVVNFNISSIIGSSSRFFWNPVNPNGNGSVGNWVQYTNGSMETAKGYIVRAPNSYPTQQQNPQGSSVTTQFVGVPHNGTISIPVSRGNVVPGLNDNYNLVGNPYPSSLDIYDFLIENSQTNPILDGSVRLWTHGNAPQQGAQNPFYGNFTYNYDPNDYLVINLTGGSNGILSLNTIGAGQGFFVIMNDGSTATQSIVFNNSMRRKEGNDIFFRMAPQAQTFERHRIWLDLINSNMNVSRTLIGYISDATNDKDALFDASQVVENNGFHLYTHDENHDMCIQGRALPFVPEDTVPLGVNVPQTGSYKIAIGEVDGLFENANQAIFLEDFETGIIHNLRQAPYEFIATQGNHKHRFVLRYTNETLSTSDFTIANNDVVLTYQTECITVTSAQELIASITVYNILGQQVASYPTVGSLEMKISLKNLRQQIGVVSTALENGKVINKKAVF